MFGAHVYRVIRLMGRQQTLSKSPTTISRPTSHSPTRTGKFFDMPKSMKAAPPQQASLKDMWNRKAKQPAKQESAVTTTPSEPDKTPQDINLDAFDARKRISPNQSRVIYVVTHGVCSRALETKGITISQAGTR
jgi:hypothetical protein